MVATPLAVVLRAKGGNFMIQTYGIPGKLVQDAAAEALDSLQRYRKDGPVSSPPDSSGDAAPNLALGQVSVLQGRFLVTYRMVNAILVLLISEPTSNAFLCLRLLDACGKVLVGACQGVEVTPERLSKRYADVHAFLGSLVVGGLAELPPAFVHSSATSEKMLSAKRIKKLLGSGRGGSGSSFIGDKAAEQSEENNPATMPGTPKKEEKKAESADPLALVEFSIPADALPPPPARAVGAKRRPPAPPRVVAVVPVAFKGAVEDESTAPAEAEGFGAFQEVKVLEAEKAGDEEGAGAEGWEAAFGGEAEAEPAPSGPTLSPADLQQALQLVEIYRGEVVAGKLQNAVVDGAVRRKLAPYGLESARFRLLESEVPVVNACLQMAARHTAYTSAAANDAYVFAAALTGSPMDCCYIKYTLPSVACLPPLQLDLLLAPPSALKPQPGKALQWEALVALRYATNPALAGPLLDAVVEVDLPPELSILVKISPSARWSPGECRLRWDLGRIEPGTSGLARAVVGAKPGIPADRAAAALRDATKARVVFSGWPGSLLSGTGLEVAMPGEDAPEYHQGRAQWFAEVVVRP